MLRADLVVGDGELMMILLCNDSGVMIIILCVILCNDIMAGIIMCNNV